MPRPITADDNRYFRQQYNLDVHQGMRFRYTGDAEGVRFGTLVGVNGAKLVVRLDGEKRAGVYHPTWMLAPVTPCTGPCTAALMPSEQCEDCGKIVPPDPPVV